jgi:hypothetical protein
VEAQCSLTRATACPSLRPSFGGYLTRSDARAELMATQSWLQDEVAELRKELAGARAELERLRATQRNPDATLN